MSAAMRFPVMIGLVVCALCLGTPSHAANSVFRRPCKMAFAVLGVAAVLYFGNGYREEYQARDQMKEADDEAQAIAALQAKYDETRMQIYQTGNALPIFLLTHAADSEKATERGETPIGFGIGLDLAALEQVLPELRAARKDPAAIVRTLAEVFHGERRDSRPQQSPRNVSSFLSGHNHHKALPLERVAIIAGIAKAYGIDVRIRTGWNNVDGTSASYLGSDHWLEFPELKVCVDVGRSREPVPTERFLANHIRYYFNDEGRVVSVAGDDIAAEQFRAEAFGNLLRLVETHEAMARRR